MTHVLDPYLSGSTEPWAVSVLQALVRLKNPRNLLELGTFEGRTTRALANVMSPNARLWTVDVARRHSSFEDDHIIFFERDAIDFLENDAPQGVMDFVFIDDDHTKEHVAREIELVKERVLAPKGLIVLHDVFGPFGLDEIVLAHGGFLIELPLLHAAGGLGVIQT